MRWILVIATLLVGACGPTDAERVVDADVRAWAVQEFGTEAGAVWARRFCQDRLHNEPRACTLNDLSATEEIAFMRWLAARDSDGGVR